MAGEKREVKKKKGRWCPWVAASGMQFQSSLSSASDVDAVGDAVAAATGRWCRKKTTGWYGGGRGGAPLPSDQSGVTTLHSGCECE